jgi:4-hydroxythreonine-4-phosphate dehydrogenase
MNARPRLALTCGEPAGIGPDLCVMIGAAVESLGAECDIHCLADESLLRQRAAQLGLPFPAGNGFHVRHVPLAAPVTAGRLDARNARWVLSLLDTALAGCRSGEYQAMVTAPVQKSVINDAGIPFTGHTEYLADRCGVKRPVMLLAAGSLRVALATTHLPLRAVPDAITADGLERTLRIVHAALRNDFGIAAPRIAVLGLNPHAGEDGHLGHEERDLIIPLLDRLRGEGWPLAGPLPADTAFLPAKLADCDAVLAMYHDQGLPVLKYSDFAHAVNITLGLPYPRVAVDHGTALEIAGQGVADPSSLFAAIETCTRLARTRMDTA